MPHERGGAADCRQPLRRCHQRIIGYRRYQGSVVAPPFPPPPLLKRQLRPKRTILKSRRMVAAVVPAGSNGLAKNSLVFWGKMWSYSNHSDQPEKIPENSDPLEKIPSPVSRNSPPMPTSKPPWFLFTLAKPTGPARIVVGGSPGIIVVHPGMLFWAVTLLQFVNTSKWLLYSAQPNLP